jgi:dynein heavy chain
MVLAFSPVGTKFRERAQKFPSLFSQCAIDWFLPWPEEALISVSTKFLGEFQIDCTDAVKQSLMIHMGKVHMMVTKVCETYFQQMRRHVYVTPKSYLSFLAAYNELYTKKYNIIDVDEGNILSGLEKLAKAGADVEVLKADLAKKGVVLKTKTEETDRLLKTLDVENKRADVKAKEVNAVTQACLEQRDQIELDKADALKDLEAALPSLEKAKKAVDSIQQKDITDISKIQVARDTVRIIFDTVQILFMGTLVPVAPKTVTLMKRDVPFIADSYDEHVRKLLTGPLLK